MQFFDVYVGGYEGSLCGGLVVVYQGDYQLVIWGVFDLVDMIGQDVVVNFGLLCDVVEQGFIGVVIEEGQVYDMVVNGIEIMVQCFFVYMF